MSLFYIAKLFIKNKIITNKLLFYILLYFIITFILFVLFYFIYLPSIFQRKSRNQNFKFCVKMSDVRFNKSCKLKINDKELSFHTCFLK